MTEEERKRFLMGLAKGFHSQMEPESVAYLLPKIIKAMRYANIKTLTSADFPEDV